MKIIEALKKIKHNREKVEDLSEKIAKISASLESEQHLYPEAKKKIKDYLQSIADTQKDSTDLQMKLQLTNLKTVVSIEFSDGSVVSKPISAWIVRRREGIDAEIKAYRSLTDRKLKAQVLTDKLSGETVLDRVIQNFDPSERDARIALLTEEKFRIDSALEIVNATTDLIELD